MSTIVTRAGKGSPLTHTEVDNNFTNLNSDKLESSSIGTTVQAYDSNLTSFVGAFTLPTTDGTSGQVLSTNGSGTLAFSTPPAGYSDSDVDTHLNTSTATTDQVLSWNGSDYDWVDQSGGGSSTITIDNKTAAYTVVAGDLNKVINCTNNTFTVALTAAATLGAGFNVTIWNTGTGVITIDPSGSETIEGLSTWVLRQNEGTQLVCNGTNWVVGNKKTMLVYAENNAGFTQPQATAVGTIAIGDNAQATGQYSSAFGAVATASGAYSTALAYATAGAQRSFAAGMNSGLNGSVTASGSGAMALGGSYASGTDSFAAGIGNNTSSYGAKGSGSLALSGLAKATGTYAVAIGRVSNATALASYAIGQNTNATGECSVSLNAGNGASNYSGGAFSFTYGQGASASLYGKVARASGQFGSKGDAQTGLMTLRRATTDATPTVLTANNAVAGTTNQVILDNNSTHTFRIQVVGMQQAADGTNTAGYTFEGVIRRGANAAATVLKNSTKTVLHEDDTAWDVNISADTTNGGLAVTVTGAAATDIRWVATVNTTEVTYD